MFVLKSYRSNVFILTALILSKIGVDTTVGLRGILGGGKGGGGSSGGGSGIKGFLPGFRFNKFASGNSGGESNSGGGSGGEQQFLNGTTPMSGGVPQGKEVGFNGGSGSGKGIFGGGNGNGLFGGKLPGLGGSAGGGKGLLGGKLRLPDFGGGSGGEGGRGLLGGKLRLPGFGGGSGGGEGGRGLLGGKLRLPGFGGSGGSSGGLLGGKGLGSGGSGGGRKPSGVFSRLNQNLPCAAGIGSLPLISRIPGIPSLRFPNFIPSGVNTCDATCGGADSNTCTYNWRDSLLGFPFLLFHCFCNNPGQCPPKQIKFGGYLNIGCENVAEQRSRCKCPYGEDPYKCTINILPVFQRKNAYYCACCKNVVEGEAIGGYGGGAAPEENAASSQDAAGGYSYPSESGSPIVIEGGYLSASSSNFEGGYSAASSSQVEGGYQGSSSSLEGATLVNDKPAFAKGKPLGSDQYLYGHLR